LISELQDAVVPENPEKTHRYLLRFYSESENLQNTGVPSISSGNKDTTTKSALLHISGVQAENEADYYCLIGHYSLSHSDTGRWRIGTKSQSFLVCEL
jgi:pre-B lymphocyte gene